jgi:hypothetical protein
MAGRKPKAGSRTRKPNNESSGPAKNKSREASQQASGDDASHLIDERIKSLGDWRGEKLAEVRRLIHEADSGIVEEWKWMGTPVWSKEGIICTGETYKQVVKLTFARGASLADPKKLFNSSLEGNVRRAIDIREDEKIDAKAFKELIRSAIKENHRVRDSKSKPSTKPATKPKTNSDEKPRKRRTNTKEEVVLLSGGNPQIAKGEGDAPVQAYIAAMPGWKREVGERVDALITQHVPKVKKAVKWNSPFYGIEGKGWFLSFHVFTRYVKVTFFAGQSLKPNPPGSTERSKEARWIDIYENDTLDEAQFVKWIKQAAKLPGWMS